ncbi:MAG: hypothetical protein FWH44_03140 [Methanomassiliicoccaceae archaeon]|nr:hypothetical protein [Methanomassiliicoccaceae archaeon]
MRILIVDGNLAVQEILFDILTMSGQKAGTVSTTDDAAKCLARFRPEAIFIDAEMCGDTSFLETVDHDLADARPKIFLLVSGDVPQTAADGYIRKPFKSSDVLEIVSNLEGREKEVLMKELIEKMESSKAQKDNGADSMIG